MHLPSVLTTNNNYQNSFGSQDIYQYSFRCDSKIIPPNRIKYPTTQNNIQAFEELKKAFHAGGNTLASLGVHNVTSYNIRNANTDTTGTFVIGQDLEQFRGKSGQKISGLDTASYDLFFSCTWSSVANADATILADFYAHFDQVLVIVDGQMIRHW